MSASALKNIDFIDLYTGEDYAEIKGFLGANSLLVPVPENLADDARELRKLCIEKYHQSGRNEFSICYDTRLYRATVAIDIHGRIELVIRQTPPSIRPFDEIPFSTPLRRSIELPNATGLILIAGEMGSGKTTSAASILSHRVALTGHLGVSIEDPAETLLQGRHGGGRCIQLEVREHEGYASATRKAFRMGASAFLLGEIRDGATAHEVLKASLSMFVVSTIHAPTVLDALERYVMFCEEVSPIAKANVASTLFVLAHQTMRINPINNTRSIDVTGFNLKNTPSAPTIKSKIAAGQFESLSDQFAGIKYDFKE